MYDVYEKCPIMENEVYQLRYLEDLDAKDLFLVYHDKKALPFFNSDNCHGNNFYCDTQQNVEEAIKYWKIAYEDRDFVRWSIIDRKTMQAIGTIECFLRIAEDYFTNCALLRVDLRSDYETKERIFPLLQLIVPQMCTLFHTNIVATKAIETAVERRKALAKMGFSLSKEQIIGQNGTTYQDYWVYEAN